jgi:putative polyhydroxyalkanoate system protein
MALVEPASCRYHAAFFAIVLPMPDIRIIQPHQLSAAEARAAAESVAQRIAQEYGLSCRWVGEVLRFERSGVEGSLALAPGRAEMNIRLGFLMSMMAPAIQAKVQEKMRQVFQPNEAAA